MEETIDVIYSNTDREALEEHFEDFTAYAAELANRLTQETVACRVDGKMFIYPSTENPKPHRCAGGSAPDQLPEPLRADEVSRMKSLQAALQRLHGVNDVRDLFCNVLHYNYVDDILPMASWPERVKQCLVSGGAPQIIADQNGFMIVYLQLADTRLRRSYERQIIQRMIKDIPGMRGLVVVSDIDKKQWNLVNVKFDREREQRDSVLLRRMRVGPGQPVRTAVERLMLVDVEAVGEETTAAELQDIHDRAFDVEAVTRQFFNDIANWYFWALKYSKFPKDAPKEADGLDHISLIRLITRLIFCWFLREKGLIPDILFDRRKLDDVLVGFDPRKVSNKESVFYRAILQNLFFATLNTEADERGWARENQNFMAHSLYRFKNCFKKPATALDLFKSIPFLNGGLFECLDKDLGEEARPRYARVDGFSRRSDSQPVVPDFLFFGREREVDLSKAYGNKKFKKVRVRGLIDTLQYYNFTIEENTPIEEAVALDPELCGKVFENLLAAYNPETGATARKQTGSFYTPREIVNYIVDEALIASLKTKLETGIPSAKDVEDRLRHLFAYNDEPQRFKQKEMECLIAAIDSLKTLDPAVGSGAFPMGILHKLVFVLGKLDPGNEQWKERQIVRVRDAIATAEKIEDHSIRTRTIEDLEQQIQGVNDAFERNELDYGRKLYLIENCIYGVDIQPIAAQIAKMRFFISLIVDQKVDREMPNLGVRPLPNLETRFVAANSLQDVVRPGQQLLRNQDIDAQVAELRRVRERHFLARTSKQKTKCRVEDARLRAQIAQLLKKDSWDSNTASRLASWDPYDQNISADFFDAEWMFGLAAGFDVVIGNPPYHQLSNDKTVPKPYIAYLKTRFSTSGGRANTFIFFTHLALELARRGGGVIAYIVPNTILTQEHYKDTRQRILSETNLSYIVDYSLMPFENAVVENVTLIMQLPHTEEKASIRVFSDDLRRRSIIGEYRQDTFRKPPLFTITIYADPLAERILADTGRTTLSELCSINQAIALKGDRSRSLQNSKTGKECYRVLDGRNISKYAIAWGGAYLDYDVERIHSCKRTDIFMSPEKLLFRRVSERLMFAYDCEQFFALNTLVVVNKKATCGLDLKYILGIMNSRLLNYLYVRKFKSTKKVFSEIQARSLGRLPIAIGTETEQIVLVELVGKALNTRAMNRDADIADIEVTIDQAVYSLYGLSQEEIRAVEAETK